MEEKITQNDIVNVYTWKYYCYHRVLYVDDEHQFDCGVTGWHVHQNQEYGLPLW